MVIQTMTRRRDDRTHRPSRGLRVQLLQGGSGEIRARDRKGVAEGEHKVALAEDNLDRARVVGRGRDDGPNREEGSLRDGLLDLADKVGRVLSRGGREGRGHLSSVRRARDEPVLRDVCESVGKDGACLGVDAAEEDKGEPCGVEREAGEDEGVDELRPELGEPLCLRGAIRMSDDERLVPAFATDVGGVADTLGEVLENRDLGVRLGEVVAIGGTLALAGAESVVAESSVTSLMSLVDV